MTIQEALDTYLRADSTLMGYLGGGGAPSLTTGRLYWITAPEGCSVPYVVFGKVDDVDQAVSFDKTDSTTFARYQFDVVSVSKASFAIEDRLRALLRYRSGSTGGLTAHLIEPMGRRERYDQETKRFIWTSDYGIQCEY
jgi:hypothetical protein